MLAGSKKCDIFMVGLAGIVPVILVLEGTMKKIALATVALCALAVPASAQVKEWKAIAVLNSMTDIEFWGGTGTGEYEETARRSALTTCESATGRTCDKSITTSVPLDWHLVASYCNGRGTTGGSQHDMWAANTRAGMKLGIKDGRGCVPIWALPPMCTSTKHACAIKMH